MRRARAARDGTHSSSVAISAPESLPPSGIWRDSCRTAWIRRLLSGSPGNADGPRTPPASTDSRESKRNPDMALEAPWHEWQCLASMGRTSRSKNSTSSAEAPASATARAPGNVRTVTIAVPRNRIVDEWGIANAALFKSKAPPFTIPKTPTRGKSRPYAALDSVLETPRNGTPDGTKERVRPPSWRPGPTTAAVPDSCQIR